ncbi:MAG: AAA family ATPase [Alphaproteobacteria bacterium]
MQIQFDSFRCFKSTAMIPIKPITLLVGENSSGKTSFQAGLKFMLSLNAFNPATFNSPPFQLGGFDDIAFSTVGRYGSRSKTFALRVRLDKTEYDRSGPLTIAKKPPPTLEYQLIFSEWLSQPALDSFCIFTKGLSIKIDLLTQAAVFSKDEEREVALEFSARTEPFLKSLRHSPGSIGSLLSSMQMVSYDNSHALDTGLFKKANINPKLLEKYNDLLRTAASLFFNTGIVRDVVAFAPIRSEPRRTYDILEDAVGNTTTGGHVPAALAQAKLRDETRWKADKEYLVKFGRNSGLFKNIDIRRLGSSQTDPFQIMLSLGGNKHNIVDVGYGVSQALPLLYEMAPAKQPKFLLLQQPEVHLHPRAQAQLGVAIVDAYRSSKHKFIIETHSDYIIDRIRNSIRLGQVTTDDVSILYFDRRSSDTRISVIELDKGGNIINPPENYRNFFFKETRDLLGI